MTHQEIDVLVAIHIFGGHKSPFPNVPYLFNAHGKDIWHPEDGPHYSTNITAAWTIVEKIVPGKSVHVYNNAGGGWSVEFAASPEYKGWLACKAEISLPRAICLAALKSIGIEI